MANRYLSFDGVTGGVVVPNDAALNLGTGDFSICFWGKFADQEGRQTVVYKSNGGVHYTVYFDTNEIVLIYGNISATYVRLGVNYFSFTQWNHYAVTVDRDGSAYMYINGVVSGTTTETAPASLDNNAGLLIGQVGTDYLSGSLDDLRIYKKAISQSEVYAIYNGGAGTKYTAAVAEGGKAAVAWDMDEGTGTTITATQIIDEPELVGTFSATGVTWEHGGSPFHRALTDEFKKHSFYINRSSEAIQFRLGGNAGKVQIRDIKLVDPLIMDDR
jgi:hypothetical protein